MSDLRIWQAICAGLFVVWLLSFSFQHFSSRLLESQYLSVIRQDLVAAVQQLAREQQHLTQRLQALEHRKGE